MRQSLTFGPAWRGSDRILSLLFGGLILAATALPTPQALAQTAGQIVPETFRPSVTPVPGGLAIPSIPQLEAPPGAENLTVRLADIKVDGGLPQLEAATARITAPLIGRVVTAAELFAAARAIGQAYAQAGHVLARVVLPAQNVTDGGTLRLLVIDGVIERVDTSRLPPRIRDRVAAMLAPLVGETGLTLARIERPLLLAGDLPGTRLRSTLTAGENPGGTILVLEADHDLITGVAALDNNLSPSLGRVSLGLGFDLNAPTANGEQVYFRTSGWPGDGSDNFFQEYARNRLFALGTVIPLGLNGWTLNLEATQSRTTPRPRSGAPQTTSTFSRFSTRLRYPVVRGRTASAYLEAAFDVQNEVVDVIKPLNAGLSEDDLRIARLAGDGFLLTGIGGLLTGRATTSFGLDAFGARDVPPPGQVPLSRQGVTPDFQKLDGLLRYQQPLGDLFAVQLEGRAQTSFGEPLPLSEQIGLASSNGLSSFYSGQIQGDSGYVIRAELQLQHLLGQPEGRLNMGLTPYLFGAYGEVDLAQATAVENASLRAGSYGVGLRWGVAPKAGRSSFGASFEAGRQERSDSVRTEDSFVFSLQLRF
jgi:hemolysin activation/secretion protein